MLVAAYVWADLRGADAAERLQWAVLYASLAVSTPTGVGGAVTEAELIEAGPLVGSSRHRSPARSRAEGRPHGFVGARRTPQPRMVTSRTTIEMPQDTATIAIVVKTALATR